MTAESTPRPSPFRALLQAVRQPAPDPTAPTLAQRQRDGAEAIEQLRSAPRPR